MIKFYHHRIISSFSNLVQSICISKQQASQWKKRFEYEVGHISSKISMHSNIVSFSLNKLSFSTFRHDVCLWRNYLIFLCCATPISVLSNHPTITATNLDEDFVRIEPRIPLEYPRLSDVLRTVIMLVRSECYEIREAAVAGKHLDV